jgi:hypothetical protein
MMTERRPEQDDALVDALQLLASTTEADPHFAATLEAALHRQAQQMQAEHKAWWRRFLPTRPVVVRPQPLRFGYSIAALLVVAALLFATTPAARATVWDWLYSFGLIEEQAITNQSLPLEHAEVLSAASMQLEAIRAEAPFAVATPTWLPVELIFTDGFVEKSADGTQVTLAYHLPPRQAFYPPEAPLLFILISDGAVDNRPLLAEEHVVPVRLDTVVGMYAQGGWRSRSPVTAESATVDGLYWDSALDASWLSWQIDGLNYLLYAQELDIQKEQMIAIAVSMTAE